MMLSPKPMPQWERPEPPRYAMRKSRESFAVYDLTRKQGSKFFSYFGKFTFLCVILFFAYLGGAWALQQIPSFTGAADTESDGSSPTSPSAAPEVTMSAQAAKPQPPKLNYVVCWGVTSNTAAISWSTDIPATSGLAYGISKSLGQTTPVQTKLDVTHGVKLTGLTPGTTYYFVAQSADKNGLTGYSATTSFTTKGVTSAPTISSVVIQPGKNNKVQISWTTSVPAYSYVQIGSTTAYNRWSTRTELTKSPHPSIAWVPSGTVHYQLVSIDANGNKATSPDATFIEP